MSITTNQLVDHLDTCAGLLLDLADVMRTDSFHSPLTHHDVKERLALIEASGDPLGLAARLREIVTEATNP